MQPMPNDSRSKTSDNAHRFRQDCDRQSLHATKTNCTTNTNATTNKTTRPLISRRSSSTKRNRQIAALISRKGNGLRLIFRTVPRTGSRLLAAASLRRNTPGGNPEPILSCTGDRTPTRHAQCPRTVFGQRDSVSTMRKRALALLVVGICAFAGCGSSAGHSFTRDGITTHCVPNSAGNGSVCSSFATGNASRTLTRHLRRHNRSNPNP